MADHQPSEGSSTSDAPSGSHDSTLQLNIKTLDSRIFSFHVDKNTVVSSFKEKIASQSGVPVGQQRLIFRGKVLKDDHPLSEYNVENGDTLHLVERQLQPPPGPRSSNGEATSNVQDFNAGQSRNRIGHIAHSVVLGTMNVGDPGEAVIPDISRVLGAVFNSMGIGNMTGGMHPGVQTSYGNETGGSQGIAGNQGQGGNNSSPGQALHGPSAATMQIPLGAIAVPTLNMPIPNSLGTLTEFMNQMEVVFTQNGNRPSQPPVSSDRPTTELPMNSRGVPSAEALSIVLQHAQHLLSGHAVPALSRSAGRLDQEGGSNDPAVREQIQTESIQLGIAMQHLGALFLELGRTILTLRMGQSPSESFVNSGPAVYISPSGPNPIMVQPFPLQTRSLFGGPVGVTPNPVGMGPVGVGNIARNVNIHIHTGASLAPTVSTMGSTAPNGDRMQGESVGGNESGNQAQARVSAGMNVASTAIPSRPVVVSTSGGIPPGIGVSQARDSDSVSSIVAEINAQLRRSLTANTQNENNASSGQSEFSTDRGQCVSGSAKDDNSSQVRDLPIDEVGETSQTLNHVTKVDDGKEQTGSQQPDNATQMGFINSNNETSTSSEGSLNRSSASEHTKNLGRPSGSSQSNNPDTSSGVPLGLGLGALQPKRRGRLPKAQSQKIDSASTSSLNLEPEEVGQKVLQSLASLSMKGNAATLPPGQSTDLARGVVGTVPTASQNTDGQTDVVDAMSQFLQSPAVDGVLGSVSQQTGVGSPDMLRNMLQQFSQNPAMRNTVNQIAQQIDSHDLGSMFSGMDGGQGGGIDLSRMMQQMMPIVSQALGGISSGIQRTPPVEPPLSQSRSRRDATPNDDPQIDLRQVAQTLENQSSSEEVLRSLAGSAANVFSNGGAPESFLDELCSDGSLVHDLMVMLCDDIGQRLHDETGS